LASFSSWLRGCACHEEDRLAGRRVVCSWGGCRAPELSARVLQARNELDLLRRQAEALEGIGAEVLHTIASTMLANILTRFAWVDELPYLILKVWRGGGVESTFSISATLWFGSVRFSSFQPAWAGPLTQAEHNRKEKMGWPAVDTPSLFLCL